MSTQGNAPENMVKHTTNQISPIRLPGSCTVTKGLHTWPRESTGQPIRVTSKQYQRTMSVSRRLQKHVSNQGGKKTSEVVSSSIDVGFHEILADFHRFPSIIEETCWKPRHQAIPSQSNSLAPRPCRDRHWCLGISSHLQQQLGTAVTSEDGEHNICIYICVCIGCIYIYNYIYNTIYIYINYPPNKQF